MGIYLIPGWVESGCPRVDLQPSLGRCGSDSTSAHFFTLIGYNTETRIHLYSFSTSGLGLLQQSDLQVMCVCCGASIVSFETREYFGTTLRLS